VQHKPRLGEVKLGKPRLGKVRWGKPRSGDVLVYNVYCEAPAKSKRKTKRREGSSLMRKTIYSISRKSSPI